MVRARKVFEVRSAIVVTQGFHMARALWLGKRAGLEVHRLAADRSGYGIEGRKSVREVLARVKAVEDVVTGAKPRFLGPKVPISGSADASRG
jgi:SanA protein